MGKQRGALFGGWDVAGIEDWGDLRSAADQILGKSGTNYALPQTAMVFILHQGCGFTFLVADGGFDAPVFCYSEGEKVPVQFSNSFAEFLRWNVELEEEHYRNEIDAGGYFLTIRDHCVTPKHLPRNSGVNIFQVSEQEAEKLVEVPTNWWQKPLEEWRKMRLGQSAEEQAG